MDVPNQEDFQVSINPLGATAAQATHQLQSQRCPGDVARCFQTLEDAFHQSSVFEPGQSAYTIVAHALGRKQVRWWQLWAIICSYKETYVMRYWYNFQTNSVVVIMDTLCEMAFKWATDHIKSSLVPVIARGIKERSYNLIKCCPRSILPHVATRAQRASSGFVTRKQLQHFYFGISMCYIIVWPKIKNIQYHRF